MQRIGTFHTHTTGFSETSPFGARSLQETSLSISFIDFSASKLTIPITLFLSWLLQKIVYFHRELVDGYIESSEDPKRQLMILTMIARHYTQKQAMDMLPGLPSYMYKKASDNL